MPLRTRPASLSLHLVLVVCVFFALLPILLLSLIETMRAPLWEGLILPIGAVFFSCLAVWAAMNHFVLRWLRRASWRTRILADGDCRVLPDDFKGAPAELRQLGENLNETASAISERDRALRAALADKDAMAREVNHRVKNNLQMISSLVSLQAARQADPYARRLMMQTRLHVSALALVHRLIYELDGSERGLVDTGQLFQELCAQLETNAGPNNVAISCQSAVGTLSSDQAVSAALIIVEAVSNAYRHGFPSARVGQIAVDMQKDGQNAVLNITDNGIGGKKSPSVPGMGHDLMRALAEHLYGDLYILDRPEGGRHVRVRFALGSQPAVQ